jgi:hypothetical protein
VSRSLPLLALAAVAVVFASCGGSASKGDDEQQIRTTFSNYTNALADGDYKKACDQLTTGSKRTITAKLNARKVALKKLTGTDQFPADCPGQFAILLRGREQLLQAAKKQKVDNVTVNGDTGTVRVTIAVAGVAGIPAGTPPQSSTTPVRREGGAWKIDEE